MDLISLLVTLVVVGLIIYLLFWFIDNVLSLPQNMNQVVKVVISVIALIWLLTRFIPGLHIGV